LKIGLTGDTHNNLKNVAKICDIFNSFNLDFVIHTGDISLPKTLLLFDRLSVDLKGVFGNNDQEEKEDLLKVCEDKNFIFKEKLKIKISKNNFLYAVHDPNDIEDSFYEAGNIIVHGHTHRFRNEVFKDTFIFNPGECAGIMKGMNKIGIIDTAVPEMEIISF
jgi:putative phosphoesterase